MIIFPFLIGLVDLSQVSAEKKTNLEIKKDRETNANDEGEQPEYSFLEFKNTHEHEKAKKSFKTISFTTQSEPKRASEMKKGLFNNFKDETEDVFTGNEQEIGNKIDKYRSKSFESSYEEKYKATNDISLKKKHSHVIKRSQSVHFSTIRRNSGSKFTF